jgi:DNA-binding transcriptional ArsR family regulator
MTPASELSLEAGAALDGEAIAVAVTVARAIAHPHRLRLLIRLAEGGATAAELARELGVEQSCLAHHLRQLRDGRLVTRRRDGNHVRYALATDAVRHLVTAHLRYCGAATATNGSAQVSRQRR